MITKIHEKAKFLQLVDPYETKIFNKQTEKYKKDYVGQKGYLIKKCLFMRLNHKDILYDMKFDDGQVWCVEPKQIKILKED